VVDFGLDWNLEFMEELVMVRNILYDLWTVVLFVVAGGRYLLSLVFRGVQGKSAYHHDDTL